MMFVRNSALRCSALKGYRDQRGVGLIEVLFAVLILAIGLLGMAGLQLTSIRNSQSAMTRGIAVVQAYSIISAMQSDKQQGVMPDAYNITRNSTPPSGTTFRDETLASWLGSIDTAMGTGSTGSVACTAINTDDYMCTISVFWDDARAQTQYNSSQTEGRVELRVVI